MAIGVIFKNLTIITTILLVVFASQQPWSATNSKTYVYTQQAKGKGSSYFQQAKDWFFNVIQPKSGRGQEAKSTPEQTQQQAPEKNNTTENYFDTAKKSLAQKVLQILDVTPQELGCLAK